MYGFTMQSEHNGTYNKLGYRYRWAAVQDTVSAALPPVSYEDEGRILKVIDGAWNKGAAPITEIPIASNFVLGGIKIGRGLSIDSTGITTIDVDTELNETSDNPVQNKIITNELNNKISKDVLPQEEGFYMIRAKMEGGVLKYSFAQFEPLGNMI